MADFYQIAEDANSNAVESKEMLVPTSPAEPIFGAWCSADFLNNEKVINSTAFFTFAPYEYVTYYWTVVRRNLEWYNGYVWGIHNKGILSSKIGAAVCDISAMLTLSGGIRFKGNRKAKDFMAAFATKRRLEAKLKQKLPIHNAIGFTLAKIDVEGNGQLDINFVQGNRYFAQVDNENNVTATYALIMILTANPLCVTVSEETRGYYLVEERFYRKDKPCIRYRMYEGPILATSPMFGDIGGRRDGTRGIEFEHLPGHVKAFVLRRFKRNILNKTFYLPFDNLGVVVLKNRYAATGMDEYGCFADSTLAKAGEALYEYDLTTTQKEESKYLSKDFAVIPAEMISQAPAGVAGDERRAYALEVASSINSGLDGRIVKRAQYMDPTDASPFIYQVPLKTDDYGNELDRILNKIAMLTGLSPATLAGYLHNGVEKTATEVTADKDNTRLTVKNSRELLVDGLNELSKTVLKYYGFVNAKGKPLDCQIVFNEGALSNPYQEVELIRNLKDAGLIDNKTAIAKANPDLDEEAVEEMYALILEEQRQAQAQPFDGLDNLGLGL